MSRTYGQRTSKNKYIQEGQHERFGKRYTAYPGKTVGNFP